MINSVNDTELYFASSVAKELFLSLKICKINLKQLQFPEFAESMLTLSFYDSSIREYPLYNIYIYMLLL